MAKVTLADVARAAGVGIATASRALAVRKHRDVSDTTRAAVRQVADELGYRPSVAARAFRSRDFHAVSILVPEGLWGWWEPAVRAADAAAREQGYLAFVQPVLARPGQGGDAAHLIARLVDVPTEGVLIFGSAGDRGMVAVAESLRLPVVAIDSLSHDVMVPTFAVDSQAGMEQATQHLLDRGRRHIAYVGSAGDAHYQRLRVAGYRSALASAGLPPEVRMIVRDEAALDRGAPLHPPFDALVASGVRLDAVVCETDSAVPGVFRSLRRRGRRVPEDVAVVGFDDADVAVALDPPLTTVRQPYERLGGLAIETLIRDIEGGHTPVGRVLIEPTLTVRDSSGARPTTNSR
ncbi:MAG: LacI family DNA-binding transcriptional regulator [Propioniciclava sp.]